MAELEAEEAKLAERIQEIMYTIPQMIDPSVPIGPDDTYNVEAQRFGEPVVPDFPIPYHTEIMESFDGIDMDAAGAWPAMASIICWATSPACTRLFWPMPATS